MNSRLKTGRNLNNILMLSKNLYFSTTPNLKLYNDSFILLSVRVRFDTVNVEVSKYGTPIVVLAMSC